MVTRHFLSLMDVSAQELKQIVSRASALKQQRDNSQIANLMKGKTAVLVFEKSSTRTRVSFETGVGHMGGKSIFLAPSESHLERGESVEDTARVLSRMADLIIMRTDFSERVKAMANYSQVPVINGLSDYNHPCQLLADIQTFFEHRGDISGKKIAWIGDGNNVCHSWMNAARQLEFSLHIATPGECKPNAQLVRDCQDYVELGTEPLVAVENAQLVVTDTWSSMGYEKSVSAQEQIFQDFQVNEKLMSNADENALFMHCLPAYRGNEVTAAVIDGPQSVVWDEAENRLHAQKALMEFLLA